MTPADFIAAFPVFTDVKVPTIQRHLDAAAPFFDTDRWDTWLAEGLGNFVAHRILIENPPDQSQNETALKGDVTSETAGGITIARDPALLEKATADPMLRTTYGQRYRYLSKLVGLGGAVV